MRAIKFFIIVSLLLGPLALAAAGDDRVDKLPEDWRKWLEVDVAYIITPVERDAFLSLTTQAERDAFVSAFWRQRDENPSTPENEYRDEHYARLAYANEFLGRDTFRQGWQTDRGRYYILLGPPRNRQNFDANDAVYQSELWWYDNPDLKRFGLPPFFFLLFFRRAGGGELELYSPVIDGPQALITGRDRKTSDFRNDLESAYNVLMDVDPELAQASLSFRTDEGDLAQFSSTSFGTMALMDQIVKVPFHGLDTRYAERLEFDRGSVESDYMFTFVSSTGMMNVMPGPGGVAYLHWSMELAAEDVAFVQDRESGNYGSVFDVSVEAVSASDPDELLVQQRNESFVRLDGDQRGSLHLPVLYKGMTPMVPGDYNVRVILRNRACPSRDESDCVKAYSLLEGEVTIPEWPKNRAMLGDIVLGYGSELLSGEPLYRAYRFANLQVNPNPTGVFAIGTNVVTAIPFINAPEDAQLRLRFLPADDAQPDAASGSTNAVLDQTVRLGADNPKIQELSLVSFDGGRYRLQVDLMDASGQTLDTRSTALTVSPRTSIVRPSIQGSVPQIRPEIPGLVYMALGEQYLGIDEKSKAKGMFERAVGANPNLGPARELLAGLELESGDAARVVELLEPVYAQVPDRFEVLFLLGHAYSQEGDYAKSAELLEKALPLKRPLPQFLNVLADAQYRTGNLDRALELLEQSLELDPDQPDVEKLVGRLKDERG